MTHFHTKARKIAGTVKIASNKNGNEPKLTNPKMKMAVELMMMMPFLATAVNKFIQKISWKSLSRLKFAKIIKRMKNV